MLAEPSARDRLGRAARAAVTVVAMVMFAYCARTAWSVLDDLNRVSVAELAQAFRVVSVRDAILCAVGWRVGRELLSTALQARRRS